MAKDLFHEIVRKALEADGWSITHDPFYLQTTKKPTGKKISLQIDLGAERIIGAEKGTERIAVEVKSFLRASIVNEFHTALGQYMIYRLGIEKQEPSRKLFVAIPEKIMREIEDIELLFEALESFQIGVIIFDPLKIVVSGWITP